MLTNMVTNNLQYTLIIWFAIIYVTVVVNATPTDRDWDDILTKFQVLQSKVDGMENKMTRMQIELDEQKTMSQQCLVELKKLWSPNINQKRVPLETSEPTNVSRLTQTRESIVELSKLQHSSDNNFTDSFSLIPESQEESPNDEAEIVHVSKRQFVNQADMFSGFSRRVAGMSFLSAICIC